MQFLAFTSSIFQFLYEQSYVKRWNDVGYMFREYLKLIEDCDYERIYKLIGAIIPIFQSGSIPASWRGGSIF